MDKLEDFIRQNRNELDQFEPSQALWNKLNAGLDKQQTKTIPIQKFWQMAAVFAVLLVGLLTLQWKYLQNHNQNSENIVMNLAQENPELMETEQFYIKQISEKKELINAYDLKALGVDKDFEKDLQTLDAMYLELKAELPQSGNSEYIIGAMIQNLQIRMDILNQQLMVLEKIKNLKNGEKTNHESNI
ncbi:MAG: hypothetical protein EAZ97_08060 [Bacteroidetes bacterium]|nr:MAG: hypothetical protein EAZ97_08060 [Bacteroidota bacterium]